MVAILVLSGVVVVVAAAEALHARRTRKIAALAFGPQAQPAVWARFEGAFRVLGAALLAWGLTTLLLLEPKTHKSAEDIPDAERRHLILVLDVSPSMRVVDAGLEGDQSRMARARDVLDSMFARVGIRQYLISVVATYSEAIPVVERSKDPEVLRNILNDLPMHYAFHAGNTDLFAGLEKAAEIAKPLPPHSTTLVLVSDGDTVPATGMPKMPISVAHRIVIGVGDTGEGSFIDGRHSRQDASMLRQIAIRLGGIYHDGNQKQVSSEVVSSIAQTGETSMIEELTKRELALAAIAVGALLISLLPWALQTFGTRWRPGVRVADHSAPPAGIQRHQRDFVRADSAARP
ncbi:MAG: VWA domain-containing protein [Planctomycetaceae bacterium]